MKTTALFIWRLFLLLIWLVIVLAASLVAGASEAWWTFRSLFIEAVGDFWG